MKQLIKNDVGFYQKIAESYSIIPIKEIPNGHKPNGSWTKWQKAKASESQVNVWHEDFENVSFGLVTGFNNLECIDVDTKVLPSLEEKQEFVKEYFELLDNHITDFSKKVCIIKTQSGGYHILYRCSEIVGNKKIAKLKGITEALIESRGNNGFVYIYDNYKGLKYHQIKEITPEERKMIWDISRTYNYEDVKNPILPKKKTIVENGLSPWVDFADKNTVLDICSDDFDIVRRGKTSTIIKRKGAKSSHSGYIFDGSGKMFLFSSGTIYPNEKPLNSFDVYAIKHFNGDYKEASKQAYLDGYGARYEKEKEEIVIPKINKDVKFPIHIFPEDIQFYFNECNTKLNASYDFMGVAFLWLISTIIGNTLRVQVKTGWVDSAILWLAVIGKAGVGKTPDLKIILKPLLKLNAQSIKRYATRYKEFSAYNNLSKEDKDVNATVEEPKKEQLIVDDITLESLVSLHEDNPKGISVFKDELAGWFKDMNKYREGSDKERFLSAWSGDSIILNRKTSEDSFVENPFISILGGIQPDIFKEFQTAENKSNGFMDRMLFCNPEKTAEYPTNDEIDENIINNYSDIIFSLIDFVDYSLIKEEDGVLNPLILPFDAEAKKEFHKLHCTLIDKINSDSEPEFFRGMYAKQITYIPRFALILEFIKQTFNKGYLDGISKESVTKAGVLSDYFIEMAKNNKNENDTNLKIKLFIDKNKNKSNKEIAQLLNKNFTNLSKKNISEVMEVSLKTIYNYLK